MKKVNELLAKLISIPSYSGKEREIGQYIHDWLAVSDLKPIWVGENVVVHVKGSDRSKALIFNAHIDTVSEGDMDAWHSDPFVPTIVDGKMYGLGASDEKAGITGLMMLAGELVTKKPDCDVWFWFVTNEEVDGSGTREVMDWFSKNHMSSYQEVVGILVEPTACSKLELGHKGNVFLKLETKGDSGHGSRPEKISQHAVFEMGKILELLKDLGEIWKKKYSHDVLGYPTLGLGTSMQAGDIKHPNKFADKCVATVDVRTVPEMHGKVVELIEEYLEKYSVSVSYLFDPAPYGLTEQSETIVEAFKQEVMSLEVGVSGGSTDQCFFTEQNIPAVIFGPGEPSCIHKPNEYCVLEKISESIAIYKKIISRWSSIV